jgi:O-antigen ligase
MLGLLPIALYLVALFVAPQLWWPAVLGWRVDLLIYPFWFAVLLARGRLLRLVQFSAQDWFFVAMLAWILLSSAANGTMDRGVPILALYAKWFLLYRMTAASIDSAATLKRAGWLVMLVASIIAVEAVQHLWSEDGRGWAGQTYSWIDESAQSVGVEHRTRWVGIFDGPGVFCVMFTVALPFALQYLAPAFTLLQRITVVGTFVPLLGMAIFSTGSRGGFLTTIGIFGFWTLARYRVSLKKLVLACVLAALAFTIGPAYLTSKTDSSGSAQHRVDMWADGIEMVRFNPVFGIGKGNFATYTGRLIAHNSAVEVMGETGLVGLFVWLGIAYVGFKNLVVRHAQAQDARERELLVGVGLSLVGYLISSQFVTLEFETFYFVLALAASVRSWSEPRPAFGARDAAILGGITATYFVLIKAFVMMY